MVTAAHSALDKALNGTVKLSRICPFCGRIPLDQRLRINDLAVAASCENAAKLLNLTVSPGRHNDSCPCMDSSATSSALAVTWCERCIIGSYEDALFSFGMQSRSPPDSN